jgi:hypothetical protein
MDQTETMCVLAGAAAIGAIWYTTSSRHRPLSFRSPPPTECSARAAFPSSSPPGEGVSAKAASMDFWEGAWSADAEEHMRKHSDPVKRMSAAKLAQAQRVTPVLPLDTTFAKSRGSNVPTLGRAMSDDAPRSVSGNCGLFYASEAYADALQAQNVKVDDEGTDTLLVFDDAQSA